MFLGFGLRITHARCTLTECGGLIPFRERRFLGGSFFVPLSNFVQSNGARSSFGGP